MNSSSPTHSAALAVVAGIYLAAAPLAAQQSTPQTGNVAAGHAYAEQHCAQCHAIEAGAKSSLVFAAPPFASLVKHKKLTTAAIQGWLRASHSTMRTTALPKETRDDLVAYIKSLALK